MTCRWVNYQQKIFLKVNYCFKWTVKKAQLGQTCAGIWMFLSNWNICWASSTAKNVCVVRIKSCYQCYWRLASLHRHSSPMGSWDSKVSIICKQQNLTHFLCHIRLLYVREVYVFSDAAKERLWAVQSCSCKDTAHQSLASTSIKHT